MANGRRCRPAVALSAHLSVQTIYAGGGLSGLPPARLRGFRLREVLLVRIIGALQHAGRAVEVAFRVAKLSFFPNAQIVIILVLGQIGDRT